MVGHSLLRVFPLVLAATAPAQEVSPAEASPLLVRWTAPATCPSAREGVAAVEQHLGRSDEEPYAHDAAYDVVLAQNDESRWVATIVTNVDGRRFERSLPATDTCAEASDAAALVVAIAVGSEGSAQPPGPAEDPQPEPAPDPEPNVVPEPAPPSIAQPDPDPDPDPEPDPKPNPEPAVSARDDDSPNAPRGQPARRGLGGAVGVFAGGGWGLIDRAAFATGLWAALRWPRLRVFVDGTVTPPREAAVEDAAVRFVHWSAGAGVCPSFPLAPSLTVDVCAALEAGQLIGRPQRLENANDAVALWLAGRVGPRLGWAFATRVAAFAGADLLVPMNRPSFEVGGFGEVARPAVVGVRGWMGIEIRLGSILP